MGYKNEIVTVTIVDAWSDLSKRLPQEAFDSIANDGIADLPAYDESRAGRRQMGCFPLPKVEIEHPASADFPVGEDTIEIALLAKPVFGAQPLAHFPLIASCKDAD